MIVRTALYLDVMYRYHTNNIVLLQRDIIAQMFSTENQYLNDEFLFACTCWGIGIPSASSTFSLKSNTVPVRGTVIVRHMPVSVLTNNFILKNDLILRHFCSQNILFSSGKS